MHAYKNGSWFGLGLFEIHYYYYMNVYSMFGMLYLMWFEVEKNGRKQVEFFVLWWELGLPGIIIFFYSFIRKLSLKKHDKIKIYPNL